MYKFLTLAAILLTFSSAHASSFLGKMGPFYEGEYSTHSSAVLKCSPKWKKLSLVASANGKYAMPRFNYREIIVELNSGKVESVLAKSESNKIKTVEYSIPANDCVRKVTINATSSGFNPGRTNEITIEIWGERK